MTERCGLADIAALPDAAQPVVRVVVASVEGSTPREAGAAMLVARDGTDGTIGGGQLEFEAIAHARALLKDVEAGQSARSSPAQSLSGPSLPLTHPPAGGSPLPRGERADSRHRPSSALSLDGEAAESRQSRGSALSRDGRGRRDEPGEGGAARTGGLPPAEASLQPAHESGTRPATWRRDMRSWPLGPSLGQCCGGAVRVLFEHYGAGERQALVESIAVCKSAGLVLHPIASGEPLGILSTRQRTRDLPLHVARAASDMLSGARPRHPALLPARKGAEPYFIEPFGAVAKPLFLYGAGHVGRAIVKVIADLDFDITWADVGADRFPSPLPGRVRQIIAPDPAAIAASAPAGAYHLVLTYSHALDLAICHALLGHPIFGFLGLIGSKTKRARFMKRLSDGGIAPAALARMTCPIGIGALTGKQPATIAISVAAQLIEQLEREGGASALDTETKLEAAKRLSA